MNKLLFDDYVKSSNPLDCTPYLRDLLNGLDATHPTEIHFSARDYHFGTSYAAERMLHLSNNDDGLKRILFDLENCCNLTICGNGARFIFDGEIIPFYLKKCDTIILKDFSIDWKSPFFIQGQVTACDVDADHFDLRLADWCHAELIEGQLCFFQSPAKVQDDPLASGLAADLNWRRDCGWNFWYDGLGGSPVSVHSHQQLGSRESSVMRIEQIDAHCFRFFGAVAVLPAEGAIVVGKGAHCENRTTPAIVAHHSQTLSLESVSIYHAGAMGFLAEDCEDVSLKHVQVTPPEGSDRMVSSTADATHFVGCRGQIELLDCRFENMLDDACNVHGTYLRVQDDAPLHLNAHSLLLRRMHSQQLGFSFARVGDEVRFSDSATLQPYATGRVTHLESFNGEWLRVQFDRDVSEFLRPDSVADNLSAQPDLTIRGCLVANNRARAFLVTTAGKVVIEKNYIQNTSMMAILLGGDAEFWHESGPVTDVTIQDNEFINCGTSFTGFPVLQVRPDGLDRKDGFFYHNNIRFCRNQITTTRATVAVLDSVSDFLAQGNRLRLVGQTSNEWAADAIFFDVSDFCQEISILTESGVCLET
ncbi:right-handed parallel beta-helix repeat-containing protein [Coraliomargarita sp. W4R53]